MSYKVMRPSDWAAFSMQAVLFGRLLLCPKAVDMTREEIVAWARYYSTCPKSHRYDKPMGDAFRKAAGVPKCEPPERDEEPGNGYWERMMNQRIGALDRA